MQNGFKTLNESGRKVNFAAKGSSSETNRMGIWKGRHFQVQKGHKRLEKGEMVELINTLHVPELRKRLMSVTQLFTAGGKVKMMERQ